MALADYRVKDVPPDMTEDAFVAAKNALGSPVGDDQARAVYRYCIARRFSPAALLAWFRHESSAGTAGWATKTFSWGNTRPPSFGAAHIGVFNQDTDTFYPAGITPPAGRYLSRYANWIDGGISTIARFFDHQPYAGKDTVRAIVPVWAPSNDGNDVERYIAAVLADIERWATPGGGAMGHVPKPPIEQRLLTKADGAGVTMLAQPRIPRGTVWHSMVGTLMGTDSHFRNPATKALTDFGVGRTDHGGGFARIIQWNDYRGRQAGWASGPASKPEGDGPAWLAKWGDPNIGGVSIERDDAGKENTPATAAQWSSLCWLTAWLHAEEIEPKQTADTFQWNMWHREFCGVAYKACPHAAITDHVEEYQAAVKAIMRHFQHGAPYPAGGLVVAGLRLATPPEPVEPPSPTVSSPFIRAIRALFAA